MASSKNAQNPEQADELQAFAEIVLATPQ